MAKTLFVKVAFQGYVTKYLIGDIPTVYFEQVKEADGPGLGLSSQEASIIGFQRNQLGCFGVRPRKVLFL